MGNYRMTSEFWHVEEPGGWYFFTLPEQVALEMKMKYGDVSGSFGTLKVYVIIGETMWQTSLFYDTKRESYLLPVKATVRKAEQLMIGQVYELILTVGERE